MSVIKAQCSYKCMSTIYEEEAFAIVVPRKEQDERCQFCFESKKEGLIACKKCSIVKYCGDECQKNDLVIHDGECSNMHKLEKMETSGLASGDFIRLLARIILKVKDKDWKTIQRTVMGKEVSFEDIESHYDEVKTNPRLALAFEACKAALKKFMGQENMPKDEDVFKIIGKVWFGSQYFDKEPTEFYFGIHLFEHCCLPNSNVEIDLKKVLNIKANKKIKNEEKVTISRIQFFKGFKYFLNYEGQEMCKCSECSLPYGESVSTKILNREKAFPVIKATERLLAQYDTLQFYGCGSNKKLMELTDRILKKHEGVLAESNFLHLKLLRIKADTVPEAEGICILEKLHDRFSSVFGEYYSGFNDTYQWLGALYMRAGNIFQASVYWGRAMFMHMGGGGNKSDESDKDESDESDEDESQKDDSYEKPTKNGSVEINGKDGSVEINGKDGSVKINGKDGSDSKCAKVFADDQ